LTATIIATPPSGSSENFRGSGPPRQLVTM